MGSPYIHRSLFYGYSSSVHTLSLYLVGGMENDIRMEKKLIFSHMCSIAIMKKLSLIKTHLFMFSCEEKRERENEKGSLYKFSHWPY